MPFRKPRIVVPIGSKPTTVRKATASTPRNPGISPIQVKPITSRETVGNAASRPISSIGGKLPRVRTKPAFSDLSKGGSAAKGAAVAKKTQPSAARSRSPVRPAAKTVAPVRSVPTAGKKAVGGSLTRPASAPLGIRKPGADKSTDKSTRSSVVKRVKTKPLNRPAPPSKPSRPASDGKSASDRTVTKPAAGSRTVASEYVSSGRTARTIADRSKKSGMSHLLGRAGVGSKTTSKGTPTSPRVAPFPGTSARSTRSTDAGRTILARKRLDSTRQALKPDAKNGITRSGGTLGIADKARTKAILKERNVPVDRRELVRKGSGLPAQNAKGGPGPGGRRMRDGTNGALKSRQADTSRGLTFKQDTTTVNRNHRSSTSYSDQRARVNINGNNNSVYINSDVNASYPTPYGAGRQQTRVRHSSFGHNRHWYDHGGYFSLGWSRHSYGRVVSFGYGPYDYYGISYYYPDYHRRYVFYSLGGYWPSYYRYRRYYWYGTHPYRWYGSYAIDQPAVYDTYNTYNTYNTYTTDTQYSTQTAYPTGGYDDFSDVREKLRQEAATQAEDSPAAETTADICFDQAVELFAQGKYEQAVFKLRVAMVLDPEDVILPFAYCQALFASGDYASAAAVLRRTLENQPEDEAQQTVYYPRGLYQDEKVLHQQIDQLAEKAGLEAENGDYQLLLGYQLLGAGRLDEAITPLHKALDLDIAEAPSMILIKLLEKIKADEAAAAAGAAAAAAEKSTPEAEETAQSLVAGAAAEKSTPDAEDAQSTVNEAAKKDDD